MLPMFFICNQHVSGFRKVFFAIYFVLFIVLLLRPLQSLAKNNTLRNTKDKQGTNTSNWQRKQKEKATKISRVNRSFLLNDVTRNKVKVQRQKTQKVWQHLSKKNKKTILYTAEHKRVVSKVVVQRSKQKFWLAVKRVQHAKNVQKTAQVTVYRQPKMS